MKRFLKFMIGGLLIAIGCGCFLYPNYREWKKQREVDSIIDSFEETKETLTEGTAAEETDTETATDNPTTTDGPVAETTTDDPVAEVETGDLAAEAGTNEPTAAAAEGPNTDAGPAKNQSSELYQAMVAYNQDLIDNGQSISDAWNYEQTPFDFPELDADNPVIGYIEIPDMGIRLPLLLGASSDNLEEGAAVLSGTSMPIGGTNTNCVIAAHRGWQGSAYFQYIEDIGPGSKVYITTRWETLVYEVRQENWNKVIDPNDVNSILIQEGKDMITLFTCHPYQVGGGPYRYLVFCDRVGTQETDIKDGEVINPKTEDVTATPTALPAAEADTQTQAHIQTSTPAPAAISTESIDIPTEDIDMLALEQALRIVLPVAVIAFAVIIIIVRVVGKKKKPTPRTKRKEKTDKRLLDNKKNKKKEGGR